MILARVAGASGVTVAAGGAASLEDNTDSLVHDQDTLVLGLSASKHG